MTNREWLNTLTVEEFVAWLVCDEEFDRKARKPKSPTPRLSTIKYANIHVTAALKEWLEAERKVNDKI